MGSISANTNVRLGVVITIVVLLLGAAATAATTTFRQSSQEEKIRDLNLEARAHHEQLGAHETEIRLIKDGQSRQEKFNEKQERVLERMERKLDDMGDR